MMFFLRATTMKSEITGEFVCVCVCVCVCVSVCLSVRAERPSCCVGNYVHRVTS